MAPLYIALVLFGVGLLLFLATRVRIALAWVNTVTKPARSGGVVGVRPIGYLRSACCHWPLEASFDYEALVYIVACSGCHRVAGSPGIEDIEELR